MDVHPELNVYSISHTAQLLWIFTLGPLTVAESKNTGVMGLLCWITGNTAMLHSQYFEHGLFHTHHPHGHVCPLSAQLSKVLCECVLQKNTQPAKDEELSYAKHTKDLISVPMLQTQKFWTVCTSVEQLCWQMCFTTNDWSTTVNT